MLFPVLRNGLWIKSELFNDTRTMYFLQDWAVEIYVFDDGTNTAGRCKYMSRYFQFSQVASYSSEIGHRQKRSYTLRRVSQGNTSITGFPIDKRGEEGHFGGLQCLLSSNVRVFFLYSYLGYKVDCKRQNIFDIKARFPKAASCIFDVTLQYIMKNLENKLLLVPRQSESQLWTFSKQWKTLI